MKRGTKRTIGWGAGAGIGVTFVILTFVLIATIQSGSIKNLHGEEIISFENGVSQIEPAAGNSEACGSYMNWIGKKVDEKAARKTGKPFRVLGPGSMMTRDHEPERINIHVNGKGVVENVECG